MKSPFSHPRKTISRAALVLSTLTVLTTGTALAAVDQGIRTGELEETVINPVKEHVASLQNDLQERQEQKKRQEQIRRDTTKTLKEAQEQTESHSETQVEVEINSNNGEAHTRERYIFTTPTPPTYPTVDFGESYEEAVERMRRETEAFKQQAKEDAEARLEEYRQEREQQMQDWEAEGQQGLEEFEAEHGIE